MVTFDWFCEQLAALEVTSSRRVLTQLLSEILGAVTREEIAATVYLLQGRVAPAFEPVQLGMADTLVARAVATAFDVPRQEVQAAYEKQGDLGNVAFELRRKQAGPASERSLGEVYQALLLIARAAGPGSQETKLGSLQELLRQLTPVSDKYLLRLVLGRLRLGIGDKSIIAALGTQLGDGRRGARAIEAAYNRTSDLGQIARVLTEGGIEAVERLPVQVCHPLQPELAERLPGPEAVIERMGEVVVQGKYDGIRVQIHKDGDTIRIFTRNAQDLTETFPELTAAARSQIAAESAILDGEAVVYDRVTRRFAPFQETARRRRVHGVAAMAEELPLSAFLFDILLCDGTPLLDRPLTERLAMLEKTVRGDGPLIVTESVTIGDAPTLTGYLQRALAQGLEGLVVKRPDSPYEAGARNFNWVKLKRHSAGALNDTIDCVILGLFAGRGRRAAAGVGALLLGVYDEPRGAFVTVSRLGTGLSDAQWREINRQTEPLRLDHPPARVESLITPTIWLQPQVVVEVLADEITRSPTHTAGKQGSDPGYALRFPRLIAFRPDRTPEDATTVKELIEMYQQQGQATS